MKSVERHPSVKWRTLSIFFDAGSRDEFAESDDEIRDLLRELEASRELRWKDVGTSLPIILHRRVQTRRRSRLGTSGSNLLRLGVAFLGVIVLTLTVLKGTSVVRGSPGRSVSVGAEPHFVSANEQQIARGTKGSTRLTFLMPSSHGPRRVSEWVLVASK